MLPSPVGTRYQRKIRFYPTSPRKQLFETLKRGSRITNLGVVLLISICAISILFNLRYWISVSHPSHHDELHALNLASVVRPLERKYLTHLIMVPCHSIWKGTNSWLDDEDWVLESYQKGSDRVKVLYEHIARGAELAQNDQQSLLIFSGGQTKPDSSTTEAESYLRLAQTARILPDQSIRKPFERATTENFAMDSYQNLLFSIARFREYTGQFPDKITVVGYDFKRPRFEELHRTALRWPKYRFDYIGVDPNRNEGSNWKAVEGERQNGYLPFTADRYGCHSMLLNKRRQRNPHARFHPYGISVPELAPLFDWCPGEEKGGDVYVFPGALPWSHVTLHRESP